MANPDGYKLGREYAASVRLNAQHYYWTDMLGYLIHPSIPTVSDDPEGLSIIDVGTGTGNWLLAVHQQLRSKIHIKTLVGTDISDGQFPHHTWLPDGVELKALSALDPNGPPEELRGKFDIVHVRYLAALVRDKPDQLIDYFSKLVKPGGYLQWGEPYGRILEFRSADGSEGGESTKGLDSLGHFLTSFAAWDWLDEFSDSLKPFGFEIVTIDHREPLPWQRSWFLDNRCMILNEMAVQLNIPAEKVKQLNENALAESRQGNWIKERFQILVARKKA